MMRKAFFTLVILLSALSFSIAYAITLDEAKSEGLVGEKLDGFIAAVTANPNDEVRNLIEITNRGRREVYAELAERNGTTIEIVGILAAEKLYAQAASNEYVQNPDGRWVRR